MGVAIGCLAALIGGIVGGVVAFAVTYWLLSGYGTDGLVWAVTFFVFGFVGIALGAGAALGLSGYIRGRRAKPS